MWIAQITSFHSSMPFSLTQKQKVNDIICHRYYSHAPSGRLWVTEGGTCDISNSETTCTRVQRASG
jgi:hypothetical protein